ncbi:MAG: hypothetical protein P8Z80_18170 [Pseudolabrys sp.]
MASLLGVTDARRKLAARYGVDPYTDFPPLDAKLNQLSQAATAGGLVVTGALMAVPGAAGVIVSNLSTANKLNDVAIDQLARGYTAAQILALNRKRLLAMKVPVPVIDKLLANRDFTPIDMAAMVAALDGMKRVHDREIFAARAAAAHPRYVAYFVRRQAELMANSYRHHAGYVRFLSLGGDPVLLDRRGRLDLVVPIDPRHDGGGRQAGCAQAARRSAYHWHGHQARQAGAQEAGLDGAGAPAELRISAGGRVHCGVEAGSAIAGIQSSAPRPQTHVRRRCHCSPYRPSRPHQGRG